MVLFPACAKLNLNSLHLAGKPKPGDSTTSPGTENEVKAEDLGDVFNVRDYGAVGDGTANDTQAVRDTYAAAVANGGGVVYFPAGTYRVAPTSAPGYVITINSSHVHFFGEGPDQSILSVYAYGMADPNDMITQRGGMFTTEGTPYTIGQGISDISFRNLRVTGNANITDYAGQWWTTLDQQRGWDITHKGIAIVGNVDDVTFDNTEWDHWRGEILYAGGGDELGTFKITRTKIHDSNGSAISMGGRVSFDRGEIYDVYNGFENFSFSQQLTEVKNSKIEVNRNLPKDGLTGKIGRFGVTFLGLRGSSLLIENNSFGDTNDGGVFLSEFAHDITIRGNTFTDTLGLYAIDLGINTYASFRAANSGFSDILMENNTFIAKNRITDEAGIATYAAMENFVFRNNVVRHTNGNYFNRVARIPACVSGDFRIEDNAIDGVFFSGVMHMNHAYLGNACPRPILSGNTYADRKGEDMTYYTAQNATLTTLPLGEEVYLVDLPSGNQVEIDPSALALYPTGYTVTFVYRAPRAVEFAADPAWNNLSQSVVLQTSGDKITFVKNADGTFHAQ